MPLYRYEHRENILAGDTMSRMPRKRDLGTGLGCVRFGFLTRLRSFSMSFFIDWVKVFDFTI